jgi:hypothetical protein
MKPELMDNIRDFIDTPKRSQQVAANRLHLERNLIRNHVNFYSYD